MNFNWFLFVWGLAAIFAGPVLYAGSWWRYRAITRWKLKNEPKQLSPPPYTYMGWMADEEPAEALQRQYDEIISAGAQLELQRAGFNTESAVERMKGMVSAAIAGAIAGPSGSMGPR